MIRYDLEGDDEPALAQVPVEGCTEEGALQTRHLTDLTRGEIYTRTSLRQ